MELDPLDSMKSKPTVDIFKSSCTYSLVAPIIIPVL
jgi:hypothetical protein